MGGHNYTYSEQGSRTDGVIRHVERMFLYCLPHTSTHFTASAMNYHAFPPQLPNEDMLAISIHATLDEIYKTTTTTTDMTAVCRSCPPGLWSNKVFKLPQICTAPLLRLTLSKYSLELVLHYAAKIEIELHTLLVVLAQNLLYLIWYGIRRRGSARKSP